MPPFPRKSRLFVVAALTLLSGCGSCAGESSSSNGTAPAPAPTGSVGPAGQRFATTALVDDPPSPMQLFARDASAPDAK
jgi:hypothetical protein